MYFGRCLVTGGTGWLGPYVVEALRDAGNLVTFVSRAQAVTGYYDVLFHLAPTSVEPFLGLADTLVVASSGAVVHKPAGYRADIYQGGYAKLKQDDERFAQEAGGQVARIYSVLGPGIPLGPRYYAAGLFLEQAIAGGPVVVKEGAVRSYLYPTDLAQALCTILAHGDGQPYDVGGEEPITVADLGRKIAAAAGVPCHDASPAYPEDVYLPDLRRLHALGWKQTVPLHEQIARTLARLEVPA